jgi:hypothetical protein
MLQLMMDNRPGGKFQTGDDSKTFPIPNSNRPEGDLIFRQ